MLVLKVGGQELDDPKFVERMGKTVAALETPPILVHGGGKEIRELQKRLGVEAQYIDGLRVTDAESLSIVKMVLAGRVNKRLVASLVTAGVDAFGMSGVDRSAVKAKKLHHPKGDLGQVGRVVSVRTEVFTHLLEEDVTPILSPICYGSDGMMFNVNADQVATAIAVALKADLLVFVSNVQGVLQNQKLLPQLNTSQVKQFIENGVIKDGMIPKVKSALDAVEGGVSAVRITNLIGLQNDTGTTIVL
ncbi:acetylglutamate kinase [Anaerolineales bacterium HSG24]|nr:acetylglutamate kinase [Anaerolineales bacterium HSG24]